MTSKVLKKQINEVLKVLPASINLKVSASRKKQGVNIIELFRVVFIGVFEDRIHIFQWNSALYKM